MWEKGSFSQLIDEFGCPGLILVLKIAVNGINASLH
jgi:hypothetical protein